MKKRILRGSPGSRKVLTNKRSGARIGVQSPALGRKEHRGGFLASNKDIVLIDGENFVHSLVRNLKTQGLIRSRSGLRKINIECITYFAKGADVSYYSNMIRVPKASALFEKAKKIAKWNAKWIPYITNQRVKMVKAGLLRVRDGKTCPKCGAKSEVLLEKGVDVRIAIDIVSLSGKNHKVFVVSSDTDLVPAIQRAVSMGHKVVYVAFPGDVVSYMTKAASEVIVLEDAKIRKAFKEVR